MSNSANKHTSQKSWPIPLKKTTTKKTNTQQNADSRPRTRFGLHVLVHTVLYTQFSIWICVHIGYPVIFSDRCRFLCRVSFWKEKKPKFSQKSFFFFFKCKILSEAANGAKNFRWWYLHWMLGTLSVNLLFCFLKQVWPSKFIKWSNWISQWRVGRFIRFNTRWRSEDYSHPLCQRCDLWQSVCACVFDFVCMCVLNSMCNMLPFNQAVLKGRNVPMLLLTLATDPTTSRWTQKRLAWSSVLP